MGNDQSKVTPDPTKTPTSSPTEQQTGSPIGYNSNSQSQKPKKIGKETKKIKHRRSISISAQDEYKYDQSVQNTPLVPSLAMTTSENSFYEYRENKQFCQAVKEYVSNMFANQPRIKLGKQIIDDYIITDSKKEVKISVLVLSEILSTVEISNQTNYLKNISLNDQHNAESLFDDVFVLIFGVMRSMRPSVSLYEEDGDDCKSVVSDNGNNEKQLIAINEEDDGDSDEIDDDDHGNYEDEDYKIDFHRSLKPRIDEGDCDDDSDEKKVQSSKPTLADLSQAANNANNDENDSVIDESLMDESFASQINNLTMNEEESLDLDESLYLNEEDNQRDVDEFNLNEEDNQGDVDEFVLMNDIDDDDDCNHIPNNLTMNEEESLEVDESRFQQAFV